MKLLLNLSLAVIVPLVILAMFVITFKEHVVQTMENRLDQDWMPAWGLTLGWFLAISPMMAVPISGINYLWRKKGTLSEGLRPRATFREKAHHYGPYKLRKQKQTEYVKPEITIN